MVKFLIFFAFFVGSCSPRDRTYNSDNLLTDRELTEDIGLLVQFMDLIFYPISHKKYELDTQLEVCSMEKKLTVKQLQGCISETFKKYTKDHHLNIYDPYQYKKRNDDIKLRGVQVSTLLNTALITMHDFNLREIDFTRISQAIDNKNITKVEIRLINNKGGTIKWAIKLACLLYNVKEDCLKKKGFILPFETDVSGTTRNIITDNEGNVLKTFFLHKKEPEFEKIKSFIDNTISKSPNRYESNKKLFVSFDGDCASACEFFLHLVKGHPDVKFSSKSTTKCSSLYGDVKTVVLKNSMLFITIPSSRIDFKYDDSDSKCLEERLGRLYVI